MRETLRVQTGIAIDPGTRAWNTDFTACLAPEPGRPSVVAGGAGGAKGGRAAAESAVSLFLYAMEELNPLRGAKANAVTAPGAQSHTRIDYDLEPAVNSLPSSGRQNPGPSS